MFRLVFREFGGKMLEQDILDMVSSIYLLHQITPSLIHEYNNIFTAIISTTQLMIEYEDDPEEMKKGFKEIQTYIERAVSLNRGVSSYVLDSNSKQLSNNQLFSIFEEMLEKELKANNSKVIINKKETTSVLLSSELLKVLFQLVFNAQDEGTKSEIIIETDIINNTYLIDVMNRGDQIDDYSSIFKLGFTNKKNRVVNDRYKRKHYGIGLSLSKHIIEKEGGELNYSYKDGLNIFSITLPK